MRRGEEGVSVCDVGKVGCFGIIEEVIKKHACVAFDGLLAIWAVEKGVVDVLEGESRIVCQVGSTKCSPFDRFGSLLAKSGVSAVESGDICYD